MDYSVSDNGQLEFVFYEDAVEEFLSYYIKPGQKTIPSKVHNAFYNILTPQEERGGVIIEDEPRRYGACA